ncbi:MAG: hypothetical protein H5T97_05515, partial [Firmicutes bacterium]|nr:hypothetical protein [Bacillota bacterium]
STCAVLGRLRFRFGVLVPAAVLAAGLGLAVLGARGIPPNLDAAAAKAGFPVGAAAKVEELGLKKPFNDYGFGGYLIWKGIPVYIDGRADLYRYDGILARYLSAPDKEDDLAAYVASTGADGAVVVRRGPFDRALATSPAWERVWADEACSVYRRRAK